jgi:hypothetical protein
VHALPRHCHAVLCTAVLPIQQRRPLARTLPVLMVALSGGARAQSASLCLTTTPPEELAGALRTLLAPAGLLGVPVADIGLTLLLSLRFMALVFDEARNLALGLAARRVAWRELGPGGNLQARLPLGTCKLHCKGGRWGCRMLQVQRNGAALAALRRKLPPAHSVLHVHPGSNVSKQSALDCGLSHESAGSA